MGEKPVIYNMGYFDHENNVQEYIEMVEGYDGTIKPIDLPNCIYVISVDGPPRLNDVVRGKGTFIKVMKTLSNIPDKFSSTVLPKVSFCPFTLKVANL